MTSQMAEIDRLCQENAELKKERDELAAKVKRLEAFQHDANLAERLCLEGWNEMKMENRKLQAALAKLEKP